MRYTFFEFENFKGIRRARLDLSPDDSAARIYTLVGLNESGKTTVLEAIDYFRGTDADDVSPKHLGDWSAPDSHSLIPIAERTNFNGEIVIRCGIELDGRDIAAAKEHLRQVAAGFRLTSLDRNITIADRLIYEDSQFHRRQSSWTGLAGTGYMRTGKLQRPITYRADKHNWQLLAAFLRSRLPAIWFFPNFLFDFPEKIYLEPRDGESDSNRFYRMLFQDILEALGRDLTIETHLIARARSSRASDQQNLRQVLLEAGRHVTETVVSSWNRIFLDRPMAHKRVLIEMGEDPVDMESELSPLWVQFRLEDSDGIFAIRERSLGFRWFFVYLMLTTYRGTRSATDANMIYLFDEPASNLHPSAQAMLLNSLETLSQKAAIILTTHSHHLIRPAWLGTTSVVSNEGLGAEAVATDYTSQRTDVRVTPYRRFAAQHRSQAHYFQPILDVLDYRPADVELVPRVVMVEGKSDFYLLSYYQMVIQEGGGTALAFMPGGGAGTLDDVIQLYLGWARPFVALLDSDKAGRAQVARYREKFGAIVAPHLIQLAEASGVSRARGIESLLSTEDKVALQQVIEPASKSYRKKSLAIGVQEALVRRQRVALSDDATIALDRVLVALTARMDQITELMEK